MSTYQFPVKTHRKTKEEFDKMKAAYVAKHGYTIHIPGISDIIKLGAIPEPTKEELKAYKRKDHTGITDERYWAIKELKQQKLDSFLNMMSSPNPTWLTNIGSAMDMLDDVNDSLGTAAVLARTGAHLTPKALQGLFMGPAGWLWTAAQFVGFFSVVLRSPLARVVNKNALKKVSSVNPKSMSMKIKAEQFKRRIIPGKGEIIEGLQVTNKFLGVGLCLGPIIGALEEAITGPYRVLQGHKVNVKWPIPKFREHELPIIHSMRAALHLTKGSDELTDKDHMKIFLATTMSIRILQPYFQEYNPLENIDGLEYIILTPPKLKSPLSREILLEHGIDPDKHVGFLHGENSNNTVQEISEMAVEIIPDKAMKVLENMRGTIEGWITAQCMADTALNGCALLAGEENITKEYIPTVKAIFTITDADYMFRTPPTDAETECFVHAVTDLAPDPYNITFKDLQYLLYTRCRIMLVKRPKPIMTPPSGPNPTIISETIGKL